MCQLESMNSTAKRRLRLPTGRVGANRNPNRGDLRGGAGDPHSGC
jgi:hypothetical protein